MFAIQKIKQLFGIQELKDAQLECLEAFSNHQDTMCILPTGYGKSVIYQMSPFIHFAKTLENPSGEIDFTNNPFITFVLTPLNSIIKDQVSDLCTRGIKACALDFSGEEAQTYLTSMSSLNLGDTSSSEDEDTDGQLELVNISMEAILQGKYNLIYAHPEALISTVKGRDLLLKLRDRVVCIAVDEAHMIFEW